MEVVSGILSMIFRLIPLLILTVIGVLIFKKVGKNKKVGKKLSLSSFRQSVSSVASGSSFLTGDNTGDFLSDFSTFRRMITPVIIQVIFWIGVVACLIGGVVFIGVGADDEEAIPIVIGIALILIGPVVVRLLCELSILFFRMNETLTEIKNEIARRSE